MARLRSSAGLSAFLLCISVVWTDTAAAASASQWQPWEEVMRMPMGQRLRLALHDGAVVVGILVEARDDALVLKNNEVNKGTFRPPAGQSIQDPLTFKRADVVFVEKIEDNPSDSPKKLIIIGVVVVAAGMLVALLTSLRR